MMDIRVEGRLITVRINDVPVMEYIEPHWLYRVKENEKMLLSQGTISLVGQGRGNLQFKNIRMEELSAEGIDVSAQWERTVDERTDAAIRLYQEDFPVLDCQAYRKGSEADNAPESSVDELRQYLEAVFGSVREVISLPEGAGSLLTDEHIDRFVDALAENWKALEISDRYQFPCKVIIQKAKRRVSSSRSNWAMPRRTNRWPIVCA